MDWIANKYLYTVRRNSPAAAEFATPNRGQFETKIGGAVAVPGLLNIVRQVNRAQSGGATDGEYMLTDAMRAAI